MVAVQATAGEGAIVVGAAVLESENFPVYPAQDDEEFADLVDPGLSFSKLINRGDTDCAGIHFFGGSGGSQAAVTGQGPAGYSLFSVSGTGDAW